MFAGFTPSDSILMLLFAALGALVVVPLLAAVVEARQAGADGRCHAAILVGFGLGAAVTWAVGWALLLSAVFWVWLSHLAPYLNQLDSELSCRTPWDPQEPRQGALV